MDGQGRLLFEKLFIAGFFFGVFVD